MKDPLDKNEILASSSGLRASVLNLFPGLGTGYIYQRRWRPYFLTGGAILTWWVIPIMLLIGFLTPWPYNYWRLKKFGIACH